MAQMTHDERVDVIAKSLEAAKRGDHDEEVRLIQQHFPLSPHLAKVAKEMWGADYLRNSGWDLSEAEAEYGKNWLDN